MSLPTLKAIIFDLDDTLFAWPDTILPARETLKHFRGKGVRLGLITEGDPTVQRAKDLEAWPRSRSFWSKDGLDTANQSNASTVRYCASWVPVPTKLCVRDKLEWNLEKAKKMGMHGIWIVWPASK